MRTLPATALLATALLAASPAAAQEAGEAGAGERAFARQCVSCHVIQDGAGEVLAGRGARVGPNLYGVAGRTPGSLPGYDYSDLMVAYGATGARWEEATVVPYLLDPTGHLREATGERGRGRMAYQVRDEGDARDLWAYLATFGDPGGGPEAEAD